MTLFAAPSPPLFPRRRPVVRHHLREEPQPEPARRLCVGLLGGSFNPAHDGHRYISAQALARLGLDQVWWLVSPQNPLKPRDDMAPFAGRLAEARRVARDPRIRVLDLEARLGTRYTVDTVRRLQQAFAHRFVWLIGADNLEQMPRWKRWQELLARVPVAVFDREDYVYPALAGRVAQRFAECRVQAEEAGRLASCDPPAWAYLRLRRHPASGTEIRRRQGGG